MNEPRPPRMATLWSVVWLVLIGTIAVSTFFDLLSRIWIWVVLLLVVIAGIVVLVRWVRSRRPW
jgi:hypothetical protein